MRTRAGAGRGLDLKDEKEDLHRRVDLRFRSKGKEGLP